MLLATVSKCISVRFLSVCAYFAAFALFLKTTIIEDGGGGGGGGKGGIFKSPIKQPEGERDSFKYPLNTVKDGVGRRSGGGGGVNYIGPLSRSGQCDGPIFLLLPLQTKTVEVGGEGGGGVAGEGNQF